MISVYGEWMNDKGDVVPDSSLLIRVRRRNRATLIALRKFIRQEILASPECDQDCIYLSNRWRGERVQ